jgi:hypothetical protein
LIVDEESADQAQEGTIENGEAGPPAAKKPKKVCIL